MHGSCLLHCLISTNKEVPFWSEKLFIDYGKSHGLLNKQRADAIWNASKNGEANERLLPYRKWKENFDNEATKDHFNFLKFKEDKSVFLLILFFIFFYGYVFIKEKSGRAIQL